MKKIFLLSALFLGVSMFTYAQKETKGPKIAFESVVHDYGNVAKSANGDCIFTFKNEGNEPLLLSSVSASCGCTTPDWTKEPIMPGQTGEIKVHYNTNLVGSFRKTVTVISNSVDNNREVLTITGTVVESAN